MAGCHLGGPCRSLSLPAETRPCSKTLAGFAERGSASKTPKNATASCACFPSAQIRRRTVFTTPCPRVLRVFSSNICIVRVHGRCINTLRPSFISSQLRASLRLTKNPTTPPGSLGIHLFRNPCFDLHASCPRYQDAPLDIAWK